MSSPSLVLADRSLNQMGAYYPASAAACSPDMQTVPAAKRSPVIQTSPAVVESELDEEAQLEAEISLCARQAIVLFAFALINEMVEPDNQGAPQGKLVLNFRDAGADTDAGRKYVHKRPVDLDRFVSRYIFNVRERYLSKLNEESADIFADGCLRVLAKVRERTMASDSSSREFSKILDEKLAVPDIAYKCFIAEILAHPRGGAYQGTPLANSRTLADVFESMPTLKGEMENIWPAR